MTDTEPIDLGPAPLRTALYSLETEQAVLGCILINPDAYFEVAPFLKPGDFYLIKHRWIWEAFVHLHDQRQPIDVITVSKQLENHHQLDEAGGVAYLTNLINTVPTSLHAEAYGRLVQRDSMRRSLLEAATHIAKLAHDETREVDALVDEAEASVFAVGEQRLSKDLIPINIAISAYYERVQAIMDGNLDLVGVPTGFYDLDKVLGGLQKSDLLIIAGRPGSGKCVAANSEIVLHDGSVSTIEDIYRKKQAQLLSLQDNLKFGCARPSAFVDDGVRPTFRVRTALGRAVETTSVHPFLTLCGWKPLHELRVGDRIAVPRRIPVNGVGTMRECEVKLLAYLIGDGCLVHSSPEFTVGKPALREDFEAAVRAFGGIRSRAMPSSERTLSLIVTNAAGRRARGVINPLTDWLRALGIFGKDSHAKFIPAPVFTLHRSLMALFLNRLFATDGWATSTTTEIGYASVSERLIRQIQHLLLRFGIIARIRPRRVKYQNSQRAAWSLEISDAPSLLIFIEQIGIYGKEVRLKQIAQRLRNRNYNTNTDTVPVEAWEMLSDAKGAEPWASLAHRAGIQTAQAKTNIHVGKRSLSRQRLLRLAEALDSPPLRNLATSDLFWDRIVAIEPTGDQQVYDLTIPGTHNFVANDVCVHNTGFMLSAAKNAAQIHHKHVAIFSLEMANEQLVQRLLSQETGIDAQRMRLGQIEDQELPVFVEAINKLGEISVFLDDTPSLTPLQLRAKCRRLQQEHGLDLIVVDYLQLMQAEGRSENRVQEVSRISRGLKQLARELNVPVLAGAQLSRAVEQRQDKRPILSDLRESGSLEQDADIVMFIHRSDPEKEAGKAGIAEIVVAKHRNGPTGSVELVFLEKLAKFENAARVDLSQY
jgi:replicative DNA helicase